MHRFMRSIGFSKLTDRRDLEILIKQIILESKNREIVTKDDQTTLSVFSMDFAENMGIAVYGEFDKDNKYTYDYYFPYMKGIGVSSYGDINIERHAEKESYAGVCDDVRVGVSLIFYLQNMIPYIKADYTNKLPMKGTSLTLSALAEKGKILLPINKNQKEVEILQKRTQNRNHLIAAARSGDEEAMESLTLDDMDTYTNISRKIHTEDVYSLVDTFFMPYGVECDQYSVLGEIQDVYRTTNQLTQENVYVMNILCNDISFDVCINEMDLEGEPAVGRRFKGVIWMQGFINFPE